MNKINLINIRVLKKIAFPAVEILPDSFLKVNLLEKTEFGIYIQLGKNRKFIFNDQFSILD